MRHTIRLTIAALAVLSTVALAACGGSDSEGAAESSTSSSSSTSAAAEAASEPCSEVYPKEYSTGEGETAGPETVEERGAPEMSSCVPEGTELIVVDDIVGSGDEVQPGATVTAHYTGIAASDGVVFDSSWSGGEPISFPLDGVIQGWTEGMVGMKVGGRRTLIIPPEMAYGDGGPAPGDWLIFTIDLTAVS